MEKISITLPPLPPEVLTEIDRAMAMSPEQMLKWACQSLNQQTPSKTREITEFISCYDCDICKNKMKIYYPLDGEVIFRDCSCVSIRGSIVRAKHSGLSDELSRHKFSTFEAVEPWQQDAKYRAMAYAKNPQGWLYMCGQVGGGKTHLCTAVVGQLIHRGMNARYMRWTSDAAKLKGMLNDPGYDDLIVPFLSADALYIDDFLKTERGESGRAVKPTTGDLKLAFQILNSRYCAKKITIISSEHTIDELISYDEAVGSRIREMSKNSNVMFPLGIQNNYRMRD